jgi:protein SCO1/2
MENKFWKMVNKIWLFGIVLFIFSCKSDVAKLDYLGHKKIENGKEIIHQIRPFKYVNQIGDTITNESLKEVVYLTDFFFTSCPSICPRVMKQMLVLHDEFKNNPQVKLVSFTMDPKRDTIQKLKTYADKIGVNESKWLFLRGDKDFTLELANDFFIAALEDDSAPGGFDHSGKIVLVDKNGHVRSFSEGTDPSTTPQLIKDVYTLLKEYEK